MDDNVIDASARFRGDRHQHETDLPKSRELTQTQYDEADRIISILDKNEKVPKPDRSRMARNLGKMIEQLSPEKPEQPLAELFQLAFDNTWESAFKKRKRFLLLEGEEIAKGDHHRATSLPYLQLSHAIARLDKRGQIEQEKRRRAVLNLIEGTSLDSRTAWLDRKSDDSQNEFRSRIEAVLKAFEKEVDLHAYEEMLGEAPMTVHDKPFT